jgi:iron complex outermembrane recepter protein
MQPRTGFQVYPLCAAFPASNPFFTMRKAQISLLFTALFAGSIWAQTPSNLQLSDSLVLKSVLIQAARAGKNSPVPHSNFSAAKIAQYNQGQDIPFLLSSVPSLVETSDAGAGVGYTGMRIRGADPTRVNVTINGIPLNDAESQGVFWVNLPDLASSAAEIQVQRGVGTAVNGPGAFGANVNIDLSKIEPEAYGVLGSTLGSFGLRRYNARFGTGLLRKHLSLSGRLSGIQSDGYIDRATANMRSWHLNAAWVDDRQSLQVHALSGHEITYQAWYGLPAQYLGVDSLRTYNPAGNERPGAPYENEVDNYTQRHYLLHYKRRLKEQLYLQVNGHYTRGFGYFEQYKANQLLANYQLEGDTVLRRTDLVRRRWLDNHFYGTSVNLRWTPGRAEFLFGGAWSRYQGKHFGQVVWAQNLPQLSSDQRYYDNDADKDDANVFVKAELPLRGGQRAFAELQLRHVAYSFLGFDNELRNVTQNADFLFFNPKLGYSLPVGEKGKYSVFLGVGRREPNRDDFTQSSPQSRPRPEHLYNLETGYQFGTQRFQLNANLYGMYYRDQLILDGRINDVGAFIRTNVPQSYRAGIELEANWQPLQRLSLNANAALSRNKVLEFTEYRDNWDTGGQDAIAYRNTDLAFSPNVVARAEAAYLLLKKQRSQLSLSVSAKHVGAQYLDNTSNKNTRLDAFTFADARLIWRFETRHGEQLMLLGALNNVFNALYASNGWTYRFRSEGYDPRPDDPYARVEQGGVYNLTGFFPQAGRNGSVTVEFRF